MKLKRYIKESKTDRYYAEVRVYRDNEDYVNHTISGRTENAAFTNAKNYAKKNLKGEGKIKINIHDNQKDGWIISSKEIKV